MLLENKVIMTDQVGVRCITASASPAAGFIITVKDQFGHYSRTYEPRDWTNALDQYERTLLRWRMEAEQNES